jgi:aryl-alcohol dehydrogenase-like predicted oxidoreductase
MNTRVLGKTGANVSEIGFGAWAIGADWGKVTDDDALAALQRALELGVSFIDTADVYGDGLSEQRIARVLKDWAGKRPLVATKAGRRLNPHSAEGYNESNLRSFIERSLTNLGTDSLDLVQLHCPPSDVYQQDSTFAALDKLKQEGLIKHYGVSVETVDEAKAALDYEGVATIQIIFNMFRFKPAEELFALAKAKNVGIIARVPLASGLLSGSMSADRRFADSDHRNYNRHGEAFDVGETFSGVDFATGLRAAEELNSIVPEGHSLAQVALRWILEHPAVSVAIPGAKNVTQVEANVAASEMTRLNASSMQKIREVYDRTIREQVHERW